MSKVLVVSCSHAGESHRVAERLCTKQGWALGQVTEPQGRAGARGLWRCVLDALLRRRTPIAYTGPLPGEFDAVVLVAPVWSYRLASPLRSFVWRYRAQLRDVAVLSLTGSRGAGAAVAEVGEIMRRPPLLAAQCCERELEGAAGDARIQAFAQALADARQRRWPMRRPAWSPRIA